VKEKRKREEEHGLMKEWGETDFRWTD